ncbi:MAG: hypothetical protein EB060_01045 [Proteobacteria bacterium]|nr:hypothetical protein [Pseudomonadota bacterium]
MRFCGFFLLAALLVVGASPVLAEGCTPLAERIARTSMLQATSDVDEATGRRVQRDLDMSYSQYYAQNCEYGVLEKAFEGIKDRAPLRALTKAEVQKK